MKAKIALWLLVVGAVVGATPSASAAPDCKTYPGSMCIADPGSRQDDIDYINSRASNESASSIYYKCGVVRDDTDVVSDGVHFYDYGATRPSCTLYYTAGTGVRGSGTTATSPNTGDDREGLFSSMSAGDGEDALFMVCTVPATYLGVSSAVNRYQICEEP